MHPSSTGRAGALDRGQEVASFEPLIYDEESCALRQSARCDKLGSLKTVKLVRIDTEQVTQHLTNRENVTYQLLHRLRRFQQDDGTVFISVGGIAHVRDDRFSAARGDVRQIRRALKRLTEMHLLQNIGNAKHELRRGTAKVYERIVWGSIEPGNPRKLPGLASDLPEAGWWVHPRTVKWLAEHPRAGMKGGRPPGTKDSRPNIPGRGRPLGSRDKQKRKPGSGLWPREKRTAVLSGENNPAGKKEPAAPERSVAPFGSDLAGGAVGSNSSSPPEAEKICPAACAASAPAAPRRLPRSPGACGGLPSAPLRGAEPEAKPSALSEQDALDAIGARLGDTPLGSMVGRFVRPVLGPLGVPWHFLRSNLTGLPEKPELSPAKVPDPPLLDDEAEPAELVQALVRCFRSAFAARYGRRPPLCRGADAEGGKLFGKLARAAKAMVAHGVAPAWWCLWSFDEWHEYVDEKRRPNIAWVCSASRVVEKSGRYHAVVGEWSGIGWKRGPKYKRLIHDYFAMMYAVRDEDAQLEEQRLAIYERFFPNRSFKQRVLEAREETRQIQRALRAQAAAGDFMWK